MTSVRLANPADQVAQVTLSSTPGKDVDHVVIGIAGEQPALVGATKELEKAAAGLGGLLPLAQQLGARSKLGHVVCLPQLGGAAVSVVGLGEDEVSPERLRRAVGNALRAVTTDAGERRVALSLDLDQPELVRAAVEGALLGAYRFTKVGQEPEPRLVQLTVVAKADQALKEALEQARQVAAATIVARDWINTPANLLYPETFADQARELARGGRLEVEVLDEKALAKQGFGGILAVGGGSERAPRLVRVDHHPRGASTHIVLVGKGITFDTGGLNLKPADGMYTMKCDMSGAAAVLAATRAIADLGLKVWVTAYAAMAENMPSGASYRPSDVITMYGGTTVENANSDAEGRLVMADALARSQADKPDLVVDVATLTGACMVALGLRTGGLLTSDDETADLLLDAAEAAGEQFWQLPIPQHIRDDLDSKVADIKSSGKRYGGALAAGAFLQRFVADGTAWAHLDIAGPAWNDESPYDHVSTGGTGAAVSTLVELARSLQR